MRVLFFSYGLHGGEVIATHHLIEQIKKTAVVDDLNIRPSISNPPFRIFKYLINEVSQSWVACNQIDSTVSHIYSTRLIPLAIASLHGKTKNLPKVFHFHGFSRAKFEDKVKESWHHLLIIPYLALFELISSFMDNIALNHVDLILVPTDASKQILKNRYLILKLAVIHVIPNGVDHRVFQLLPSHKKTYDLLWVGRISPEKNGELFIQIAELLPRSRCFVAAVSTGTSYEKKLLTKMRSYKNIEMMHNLSPIELSRVYNQSALTIITSRTEQFPLTYLESIACGTPVITPHFPSILSIQHRISPQLLVTTPSAHQFVHAIQTFNQLSSKEKSVIIQQCITEAAPYSWRKSAAKVNQLFRMLSQ